MHRSSLALVAALTLTATITACTDSKPNSTNATDNAGTDNAGTDNTTGSPTDNFEFQPFGADGVESGHLQVPIDYGNPSLGTIDLYVTRHLADDPAQRIGSLLVNPGGPGFGGSDFAIYANQIYSQALLDRFDIVAWDPRGTGLSEPAIDCVDNYDLYFTNTDITPDDDSERQQLIDLAQEFADACVSKNADLLPYVGTNNSARDMDAIRQALGEDKISYFGFSYGSELGATWATLFPETVRAAVLDGAADPNADFIESGLQQSAGFEGSIATFLAQCSDDVSCSFHNGGDAEGSFDVLMADLDENPIPTVDGRPYLSRAMALTGVAEAMYTETRWPELAAALSDAQDGDGNGLLALYDSYYVRQPDGSYDNSLEAFQVIVCADDSERLTVAEDDATAEQYTAVAPRFAPGTTGSYFCTFFPAAQDPRVTITGNGAGPILVMGTTGDPSTPLESSRNMADALEDGRFVIVTADQHTGYGVNQCSYDVIDNYLIDPVADAPEDGFTCE
ncbi:MAG: alpha/beta fold hydrolase [Actinobacteria bacterium]|nr:alpha/beta fold hydrolase [Actinomycetota bacterium]